MYVCTYTWLTALLQLQMCAYLASHGRPVRSTTEQNCTLQYHLQHQCTNRVVLVPYTDNVRAQGGNWAIAVPQSFIGKLHLSFGLPWCSLKSYFLRFGQKSWQENNCWWTMHTMCTLFCRTVSHCLKYPFPLLDHCMTDLSSCSVWGGGFKMRRRDSFFCGKVKGRAEKSLHRFCV